MREYPIIAVFTYNRLDYTRRMMDSLLECEDIEKHKIIFFSDGPNPILGENDVNKIKEVREYISETSKKHLKEYEMFFSKDHKACRTSIIQGISYALSQKEAVIHVEDDLILSKLFLRYMDSALDYFKGKDNVWSVSGYTPPFFDEEGDYPDVFMLQRISSWGMGIWKDRWEKIDWTLSDVDLFFENQSSVDNYSKGGYDLPSMLYSQTLDDIDAWDIVADYYGSINNMYTVYPKKTFLFNIGAEGTHLRGKEIPMQKTFGNNSNLDFSITQFNQELNDAYRTYYKTKEEYLKDSYKTNVYHFYYHTMRRWLEYKVNDFSLKPYFSCNHISSIIIYGAGDIGRLLMSELINEDIDVVAFIDKNTYGCEIEGIKVLSIYDEIPVADLIIVTPVFAFNDIKKTLNKMGYNNVVSINYLLRAKSVAYIE